MSGSNGAAKEPLVKASKYLDAADFVAAIVAEPEDVEIPGKGWVQIRGLTTLETEQVITAATVNGKQNTAILMTQSVLRGLIQPRLSESYIEALMNAGGGYILPLAQRIMALSGLGNAEDFQKKVGDGSLPTVETKSDPTT